MKFNCGKKLKSITLAVLMLTLSVAMVFAETPAKPTETIGEGVETFTHDLDGIFKTETPVSNPSFVVTKINIDDFFDSLNANILFTAKYNAEDYFDNQVAETGKITGGVLNNTDTTGTVDISKNFINNVSHSIEGGVLGGALANTGKLNEVTGNFVFNGAVSYTAPKGGAFYNDFDKVLGTPASVAKITGAFIGNYAFSDNDLASGGAVFNIGKIDSLIATFKYNIAQSSNGSAYGGAVYNSEISGQTVIGDIVGDFTKNKALALHTGRDNEARGGAIYNTQKIGSSDGSSSFGIKGNFIGNYAEAQNTTGYANAYGGAISNSTKDAVISSIQGDFTNNYVYSHLLNVSATDSYAYGGAIYNNNARIGLIDGDFVGNYARLTFNKHNGLGVAGGAIFNSSGSIGTVTGSFVNNKVYADNYGIAYGGAIYNDAPSKIASISATGAVSTYSQGLKDSKATVTAGEYAALTEGQKAIYEKVSDTWTRKALYLNGSDLLADLSKISEKDLFIRGNSAQEGGAIYNLGELDLIAAEGNIIFAQNTATNNDTTYVAYKYNSGANSYDLNPVKATSNAIYNEGSMNILAKKNHSVSFSSNVKATANNTGYSGVVNNVDSGESIVNHGRLTINAAYTMELQEGYKVEKYVNKSNDGDVILSSAYDLLETNVQDNYKPFSYVRKDDKDITIDAETFDKLPKDYKSAYEDYTGTVNLQGVYDEINAQHIPLSYASMEIARGTVNAYGYIVQDDLTVGGEYDTSAKALKPGFATLNIDASHVQIGDTFTNNGLLNLYDGRLANSKDTSHSLTYLGDSLTGKGVTHVVAGTSKADKNEVVLLSGLSIDQQELHVEDNASFSADASAIGAKYDETKPISYKYLAEDTILSKTDYEAKLTAARTAVETAGGDSDAQDAAALEEASKYSLKDYEYTFYQNADGTVVKTVAEYNALPDKTGFSSQTTFKTIEEYAALPDTQKADCSPRYQEIKEDVIIGTDKYEALSDLGKNSYTVYHTKEGETAKYSEYIVLTADATGKTTISKAEYDGLNATDKALYTVKYTFDGGTTVVNALPEGYTTKKIVLNSDETTTIEETAYNALTVQGKNNYEGYEYELKGGVGIVYVSDRNGELHLTSYSNYSYNPDSFRTSVIIHEPYDGQTKQDEETAKLYIDEYVRAYEKIGIPVIINNNVVHHDYGSTDDSRAYLYIDPDLLLGPDESTGFKGVEITNKGVLALEGNDKDENEDDAVDTLATRNGFENDGITPETGIKSITEANKQQAVVVINKGHVTLATGIESDIYVNDEATLTTPVKYLKDGTVHIDSMEGTRDYYYDHGGGILELIGGENAEDPYSKLKVNIGYDDNTYTENSPTRLIIKEGVVEVNGYADADSNANKSIGARSLVINDGATLNAKLSQISVTDTDYTHTWDRYLNITNNGIFNTKGKTDNSDTTLMNSITGTGTFNLVSGNVSTWAGQPYSGSDYDSKTIKQKYININAGASLTTDVAALTVSNDQHMLTNNGTLKLRVQKGKSSTDYEDVTKRTGTFDIEIAGSTGKTEIVDSSIVTANRRITQSDLKINSGSELITNASNLKITNAIQNASKLTLKGGTAANGTTVKVDKFDKLTSSVTGDGTTRVQGGAFVEVDEKATIDQSINFLDTASLKINANSIGNPKSKTLTDEEKFAAIESLLTSDQQTDIGGKTDAAEKLAAITLTEAQTNAIKKATYSSAENPVVFLDPEPSAVTRTPRTGGTAAKLILTGGVLDNDVKDALYESTGYDINTIIQNGALVGISNGVSVDNLTLEKGGTLDLIHNNPTNSALPYDTITVDVFTAASTGSSGLSFDIGKTASGADGDTYADGTLANEKIDVVSLDKIQYTTSATGNINLKSINIVKDFNAPAAPSTSDYKDRYFNGDSTADGATVNGSAQLPQDSTKTYNSSASEEANLAVAIAAWKANDRRVIDLFVKKDSTTGTSDGYAEGLIISPTTTVHGGYMYQFEQNTETVESVKIGAEASASDHETRHGQLFVTRIPVADWSLQDIIAANTKYEGTTYAINTFTLTHDYTLDYAPVTAHEKIDSKVLSTFDGTTDGERIADARAKGYVASDGTNYIKHLGIFISDTDYQALDGSKKAEYTSELVAYPMGTKERTALGTLTEYPNSTSREFTINGFGAMSGENKTFFKIDGAGATQSQNTLIVANEEDTINLIDVEMINFAGDGGALKNSGTANIIAKEYDKLEEGETTPVLNISSTSSTGIAITNQDKGTLNLYANTGRAIDVTGIIKNDGTLNVNGNYEGSNYDGDVTLDGVVDSSATGSEGTLGTFNVNLGNVTVDGNVAQKDITVALDSTLNINGKVIVTGVITNNSEIVLGKPEGAAADVENTINSIVDEENSNSKLTIGTAVVKEDGAKLVKVAMTDELDQKDVTILTDGSLKIDADNINVTNGIDNHGAIELTGGELMSAIKEEIIYISTKNLSDFAGVDDTARRSAATTAGYTESGDSWIKIIKKADYDVLVEGDKPSFQEQKTGITNVTGDVVVGSTGKISNVTIAAQNVSGEAGVSASLELNADKLTVTTEKPADVVISANNGKVILNGGTLETALSGNVEVKEESTVSMSNIYATIEKWTNGSADILPDAYDNEEGYTPVYENGILHNASLTNYGTINLTGNIDMHIAGDGILSLQSDAYIGKNTDITTAETAYLVDGKKTIVIEGVIEGNNKTIDMSTFAFDYTDSTLADKAKFDVLKVGGFKGTTGLAIDVNLKTVKDVSDGKKHATDSDIIYITNSSIEDAGDHSDAILDLRRINVYEPDKTYLVLNTENGEDPSATNAEVEVVEYENYIQYVALDEGANFNNLKFAINGFTDGAAAKIITMSSMIKEDGERVGREYTYTLGDPGYLDLSSRKTNLMFEDFVLGNSGISANQYIFDYDAVTLGTDGKRADSYAYSIKYPNTFNTITSAFGLGRKEAADAAAAAGSDYPLSVFFKNGKVLKGSTSTHSPEVTAEYGRGNGLTISNNMVFNLIGEDANKGRITGYDVALTVEKGSTLGLENMRMASTAEDIATAESLADGGNPKNGDADYNAKDFADSPDRLILENTVDILNQGTVVLSKNNTLKTILNVTTGEPAANDTSSVGVVSGKTVIVSGGEIKQNNVTILKDAELATEYVDDDNLVKLNITKGIDNQGTLTLNGAVFAGEYIVDTSEDRTGKLVIDNTATISTGIVSQKEINFEDDSTLTFDANATLNVGDISSTLIDDGENSTIKVSVTDSKMTGQGTLENNGKLNINATKDTVVAIKEIKGTGDTTILVKNDANFLVQQPVTQNSIIFDNADIFGQTAEEGGVAQATTSGKLTANTITNHMVGKGLVIGANVKSNLLVNDSYNFEFKIATVTNKIAKNPILTFQGQSPITVEGILMNSSLVNVKTDTTISSVVNMSKLLAELGADATDEEKYEKSEKGIILIDNGVNLNIKEDFVNDVFVQNNGIFTTGVYALNTGTIFGTLDEETGKATTGKLVVNGVFNNSSSDKVGLIYQKDLEIGQDGNMTTDLATLNIATNKITNDGLLNLTNVPGDVFTVDVVGNEGTGNIDFATGRDIKIDSTIDNVGIIFHSGEITFSKDSDVSTATLNINEGAEKVNFEKDERGVAVNQFAAINLNTDVEMAMDFVLIQDKMDQIKVNPVDGFSSTNDAMITLTGLPAKDPDILLKDVIVLDPFADEETREQAKKSFTIDDSYRVLSPIFKYHVNYDQNEGKIILTGGKDYDGFNPGIYDGMVGALVGMLNQYNSYELGFQNEDTREIVTHGFSDRKEKTGITVVPYGAMERINLSLNKAPVVKNTTYGSLLDIDTSFIGTKGGWDNVLAIYGSYDGSKQSYDGVSMEENGAHAGARLMVYKDNFYAGFIANAGFSNANANTSFGKDKFTFMSAGASVKAGFNWVLGDNKVSFQPNWMLSHSWVDAFDYTTASGVKVKDDPYHSIQITAGTKFAANFTKNLQFYGEGKLVYATGNPNFKAFGVELPILKIDPYIQFSAGLQRNWTTKNFVYLQASGRVWGREGISITAGAKIEF